jgi:hypothetical protein
MSTERERFGQWQGNWGYIGEWCGKRWPTLQPPYREKAERAQPQLGPVKEFIDTILERTGVRRASSGTRRIAFICGFGGRSRRQAFPNRRSDDT